MCQKTLIAVLTLLLVNVGASWAMGSDADLKDGVLSVREASILDGMDTDRECRADRTWMSTSIRRVKSKG